LTQHIPLSLERTVEIARQVCEALAYAHAHSIVHRDIKPENILLDAAGGVKVADFGIARGSASLPHGWTITATGATAGTPHYMAPEAIAGADPDPRMDVYSLGVVMYQMLTHRLPLGNFDSLPAAVDRI